MRDQAEIARSRRRFAMCAPEIAVERGLELMRRDKKVEHGAMRFVVLERLGFAIMRGDVSERDVSAALSA